ncbi:Nucleoside diphosphate kinase [Caligus rogercresseyi]|uniref:nucleoside-diphosphate kinase n=1 Tax=Caligus rogercresseyi TaxID=217165 RepID=A0A7T8JTD0_CALRO|nr:Nucleoside diphosphate kinase [Caligus rogercresseyi]
MIKPDGMARRLLGDTLTRLERKGFKLRALKMTKPSKDLIEAHYLEHKEKPFFGSMMEYISSAPLWLLCGKQRMLLNWAEDVLDSRTPRSHPVVQYVGIGALPYKEPEFMPLTRMWRQEEKSNYGFRS